MGCATGGGCCWADGSGGEQWQARPAAAASGATPSGHLLQGGAFTTSAAGHPFSLAAGSACARPQHFQPPAAASVAGLIGDRRQCVEGWVWCTQRGGRVGHQTCTQSVVIRQGCAGTQRGRGLSVRGLSLRSGEVQARRRDLLDASRLPSTPGSRSLPSPAPLSDSVVAWQDGGQPPTMHTSAPLHTQACPGAGAASRRAFLSRA